MSSLLPFIFGLVIGWLIELVIDYFYWRRRSVNTEAEQNLRASLNRAQTENNDLQTQLAGFQAQDQRLIEFETSFRAKEAELKELSSSYEEKEKALASQVADLQTKEAELKALSASYEERSGELDEAQTQITSLAAQTGDLEAKLADCESRQASSATPDAGAEAASFAVTASTPSEIEPDDLRKIWGIGPKIAKILRDNGINTFAELAATDVARLDAILLEAGSRFRISKQGTWADQARLAAEGKWEELTELQDKMDWKGSRRL